MVKVQETWTGGEGKFAVIRGGAEVPPDFTRTLAALGDNDLREEIQLGLGGNDFQAAARAEAGRRGLTVL